MGGWFATKQAKRYIIVITVYLYMLLVDLTERGGGFEQIHLALHHLYFFPWRCYVRLLYKMTVLVVEEERLKRSFRINLQDFRRGRIFAI